MTRPTLPTLTAVAVLALAGCGGTSDAANPAAPPPPPTTTPAIDPEALSGRTACHLLSESKEFEFVWMANREVASAAQLATDRAIASAGARLHAAAMAAYQAGEEGSRGAINIELSRARLELGDACGTLFGDGPW